MKNKNKNQKKLTPYLLIAPSIIFYLIFWIYPVLNGIKEVFTDYDGNLVLLDNFILTLNSDLSNEAFINTMIFGISSIIIQFISALAISLLLRNKFKGSKIIMFIAMIPIAITPTAVAILWKTGLIKEGWLNTVLLALNIIDKPLVFLNVEGLKAVILILLIDTWTVVPSVMIILIAGLQNINKEVEEAAYIFGASKMEILKDIILPMLKPTIITAVILRLIAALQVWNIAVMVLGYGKAPFLVERVAFYVEMVPGLTESTKIAFTYSFITTIIVLITTMIYLKVSNKNRRMVV